MYPNNSTELSYEQLMRLFDQLENILHKYPNLSSNLHQETSAVLCKLMKVLEARLSSACASYLPVPESPVRVPGSPAVSKQNPQPSTEASQSPTVVKPGAPTWRDKNFVPPVGWIGVYSSGTLKTWYGCKVLTYHQGKAVIITGKGHLHLCAPSLYRFALEEAIDPNQILNPYDSTQNP